MGAISAEFRICDVYLNLWRPRWRMCAAFYWLVSMLGVLSGCYGDAVIMVSGVVIDADSTPITGANVHLESTPDSVRCAPDDCVTSEDGKFWFTETFAPPGSRIVKFRLSVKKDGYAETEEILEGTGSFSREIRLRDNAMTGMTD